LADFSPFGRLFSLGSFLKIIEVAQNFWATYIHGKSYLLLLRKNCLASFWAILFHKNYLVTLASFSRQKIDTFLITEQNVSTHLCPAP
jgi:hypothetical protein